METTGLPNVFESQGPSLNLPSNLAASSLLDKSLKIFGILQNI